MHNATSLDVFAATSTLTTQDPFGVIPEAMLRDVAYSTAGLIPAEAEVIDEVFTPRQIFHAIDGVFRTFQPLNEKPNMEKYFTRHELRQYLEFNMPCAYGVASYEDIKKAKLVLEHGLTFDSQAYEVLTGWVKNADGATLILVPRGSNLTLRQIGLFPILKKQSDIGKFMKYLKRECAQYRTAVEGSEQVFGKDRHGNFVTYKMNGEDFKVRYDAHIPAVNGLPFVIEGCFYVTPRFANAHFGLNPDTGKKWKTGQTGRATFSVTDPLSPEDAKVGFMEKGHFMVWDMKHVDASFWDTKKIIGTEKVFVGFMGTLHPGKMHLSIQATVNFGLMPFALDYAKLAMHGYADEMADPDFARKQFVNMFMDKLDQIGSDNDDNGVTAAQINNWRMMAAVKDGFEYHEEPFMQRDAYRKFSTHVCNVTKGKVPVPETDGFRAYYFIDPWTITDEGTFDPSRQRLKGNCVYSPRLKNGQKLVTFRDPQTRHEFVPVYNVAPKGKLDIIDPNVLVVSIDCAMPFAADQGGGDYDDTGNIYVRKEIVAHFANNLPAYPKPIVAVKGTPVADWADKNMFAVKQKLHVVSFDKKALNGKLDDAANAGAGIGMIVNWLMACADFSFYLDTHIAEVKTRIALCQDKAELERLEKALGWLNKYDRYHENFVMSALEDAIDGLAMNGGKGGTDYSKLGDTIRGFWADCPCIQYWMTVGGAQDKGRVSDMFMSRNPVILEGPISASIREMESYKAQLDELVNAKQWLGLRHAPTAVVEYPCNPEVLKTVKAGKKAWKESLAVLRLNNVDGKAFHQALKKISLSHSIACTKRGHEFAMMYIAQLEREVHTGARATPMLFDGKVIGVKDAYLNSPSMFQLRRQLYKELGLTKELHAVKLYDGVENGTVIEVKDGTITDRYDGDIYGLDMAVADGLYVVNDGLIRLTCTASENSPKTATADEMREQLIAAVDNDITEWLAEDRTAGLAAEFDLEAMAEMAAQEEEERIAFDSFLDTGIALLS
jgi:hypothetical protein